LPHPDRLYRCPVCKLHMTFDPVLKKMQPAADGHDNDDTQGHAV
jgi:hypothetical protein